MVHRGGSPVQSRNGAVSEIARTRISVLVVGRSCVARTRRSGATLAEAHLSVGLLFTELYFQVNGACLCLPLLRERRDDIPYWEYFLTKRFTDARRRTPFLNRRVPDLLLSCDWPGRMRDLENLALKIIVFGKTCESNPAGKKALAANERGFSICPATG